VPISDKQRLSEIARAGQSLPCKSDFHVSEQQVPLFLSQDHGFQRSVETIKLLPPKGNERGASASGEGDYEMQIIVMGVAG
jgi:hypothetical protein